jgi:hypothetical protein
VFDLEQITPEFGFAEALSSRVTLLRQIACGLFLTNAPLTGLNRAIDTAGEHIALSARVLLL